MIPKFRAWNKDKKLMLNVIAINFELLQITADIENKKIYPDLDYWWKETDIPFSEIVLMESTGLLDKNGVEIYEGDIVAFEDSDGGYEYQDIVVNTGIVEYGDLGFYFTNRVAVDMADFYIKDGRCYDVEVIGNIYENQDFEEAEDEENKNES